MTSRLRTILSGATAGAVMVLVTASVLFLLLTRLGDGIGAVWASRVAVVATGVTVVALAAAFLSDRHPGT